MKLEQNISNIENCFNSYENIQIQHLDIMKSKDLPNLDLLTQERTTVFQILKTALDTFMENAGSLYGSDSLSAISRYEGKLASILKLDEDIAIEIKKHQEHLKVSLARLKKGKTALNGYRKAGTQTTLKPFVLNIDR